MAPWSANSSDCAANLAAEWTNRSSDLLKKIEGLSVYVRHRHGFYVQSQNNSLHAKREVHIDALLHNQRRWRHEVWSYNGANYSFIDIGFKNLEEDFEELNRLVIDHLVNFPGLDLSVRFGESRIADLRQLNRLRWTVHDRVLERYGERKHYLGWADYAILKYVNYASGNSDVFALVDLEPRHSSLYDLSEPELRRRLLAAVQINYFGRRIEPIPTTATIAALAGRGSPGAYIDKFPFEYRTDPQEANAVHRLLESMFYPLETAAEITRYAKFTENLPKPIQCRLLLEVHETLKRRGIKTSLASLDRATFRLFRRQLGFQKLFTFTPREGNNSEIVAFRMSGTESFRAAYERLQQCASGVSVRGINE